MLKHEPDKSMGKYSTEELCAILRDWKTRLRTHNEWDESLSLSDDWARVEISRKLRAADALCETAKKTRGPFVPEYDAEYIDGILIGKLKAAIAKYEGK